MDKFKRSLEDSVNLILGFPSCTRLQGVRRSLESQREDGERGMKGASSV